MDSKVLFTQTVAFALILIQFGFVYWKYVHSRVGGLIQYSKKEASYFLMSHFGLYMVFSALITGAFMSTYRIEQYLYFANYAIIMLVLPKLVPTYEPREINAGKWLKYFTLVLAIIAILAFIAINSHEPYPNEHRRFEF